MFIQDPEMSEYLDLSFGFQVLVSEKDNTPLIDQCSKLIQLLLI